MTLFAQDPQSLPREAMAPQGSPATLPSATRTGAQTSPSRQNEVILDRLLGIVLIESASQLNDKDLVQPAAEPVRIRGDRIARIPGLAQKLSSYVGKPLVIGDLNTICADIVTVYTQAGYPVVSPIISEQDLTRGVLRIVVLEAKVGDVKVVVNPGKTTVADAAIVQNIQKQLTPKPGDDIRADAVLEDLDWLNRNAFQNATISFERGKSAGLTDVVYNVDRLQFPVRMYAGYENTGTAATGDDRFLAGLNWNDAFGRPDNQLSLQATSGDQLNEYQAYGASYLMPISSLRHVWSVYGSWSSSQVQGVTGQPDINTVGTSWQIGTRYAIPLARHGSMTQQVDFALDFKHSNNNLEFGGTAIFDRSSDIVNASVGYTLANVGQWGSTQGDVHLFVSPGHLSPNNGDDEFTIARPGAKPAYAYLRGTLAHTIGGPDEFQLHAEVRGQVSSGALLSSEQFDLGGHDSVRGYRESAGLGDDGVLGQIELRSPGLSPLKALGRSDLRDRLNVIAFVDGGLIFNHDAQDGFPSQGHAIGAGLGVRYQLGQYVSLAYDYGWQIDDDNVNSDGNGRHHLSVTASFSW